MASQAIYANTRPSRCNISTLLLGYKLIIQLIIWQLRGCTTATSSVQCCTVVFSFKLTIHTHDDRKQPTLKSYNICSEIRTALAAFIITAMLYYIQFTDNWVLYHRDACVHTISTLSLSIPFPTTTKTNIQRIRQMSYVPDNRSPNKNNERHSYTVHTIVCWTVHYRITKLSQLRQWKSTFIRAMATGSKNHLWRNNWLWGLSAKYYAGMSTAA